MSDLRTKVSHVIDDLENALQVSEDVAKEKELLDKRELELRELEKSIAERQDKLDKQSGEIIEQRQFIDRKNKELAEWEAKIISLKDEAQKVLEKKSEIEKNQVDLDEKIKMFTTLKQRDEELNHREAQILTENEISRKRLELIDLKEKKIKQRETQLQIKDDATEL